MTWREITLGECFTVKHGYAFKGDYFAESGQHIVLTPGNFNEEGGFRARPGKDRFYAVEPPEDFILKPGDLIVAMTEQGAGLLGSSALVPAEGSYLHNQRIGLIENLDTTKLNRRYLYHLFNTPSVRSQIRASATGGKVRHTAPTRIYVVKVRVPSISKQSDIAETISVYDKLIENNRRRITLLEESARLLYREWFVYFRFPGHERVKLVQGLPKSWRSERLSDVAETNRNTYRSDELPDEINYVDISSVTKGRIVFKTRLPSTDAPGRARRRAVDGDVIWSNVRPNLRAYALVLEPKENDVFSTGFTILSAKDVPFTWLYLFVTAESFVGYLANHATGVGYPAVRPDDFERAAVVVPPKALLNLFHESTEPNFRLIYRLDQQNRKLAEARDLLLPRLMNGVIEV